MTTSPSTEWYKDEFLVSTKTNLLDLKAINEAFSSDMLYWAKPLDEPLLRKMLDKSLCFGLYELPASTSAIAGKSSPKQIGLARMVTDEVSLAYLTDVYVLQEYQGKGLGSWVMKCLDETLSQWPALRRLLLLTSQSENFYTKLLKVQPFQSGDHGLKILNRFGGGSVWQD